MEITIIGIGKNTLWNDKHINVYTIAYFPNNTNLEKLYEHPKDVA